MEVHCQGLDRLWSLVRAYAAATLAVKFGSVNEYLVEERGVAGICLNRPIGRSG